ncbi:hypothetical protein JB92DRAFT_3094157 [Gautieria morchelliformis]|nr:hypothetical protein JB92DRAFT_3094157 [Gautieria morchelliformis]
MEMEMEFEFWVQDGFGLKVQVQLGWRCSVLWREGLGDHRRDTKHRTRIGKKPSSGSSYTTQGPLPQRGAITPKQVGSPEHARKRGCAPPAPSNYESRSACPSEASLSALRPADQACPARGRMPQACQRRVCVHGPSPLLVQSRLRTPRWALCLGNAGGECATLVMTSKAVVTIYERDFHVTREARSSSGLCCDNKQSSRQTWEAASNGRTHAHARRCNRRSGVDISMVLPRGARRLIPSSMSFIPMSGLIKASDLSAYNLGTGHRAPHAQLAT